MSTNTERIPIPSDPEKLIDLGVKVYARHCVVGNKSPLLYLQSNSWEENGSEVNNALRLYELIKKESLSQEYLCKLDELIVKIRASILASYDLLLDIYSDPQELGFWGFVIDKSIYDKPSDKK
ncbi:MAG: hypothetical protein JZU53_15600 [Paludibacter sp.]|nr:hypothetical protein [Paludibacter sp.]